MVIFEKSQPGRYAFSQVPPERDFTANIDKVYYVLMRHYCQSFQS